MMTLTNRLMLFFVGTLAVILIGFSAASYGLTNHYLHHQARDQLESALNTLVAATEIAPDGVEWEPRERLIALGSGPFGEAARWLVTDGAGRSVDQSSHADNKNLWDAAPYRLSEDSKVTSQIEWHSARWLIGYRRVLPGGVSPSDQPHQPRSPQEIVYPVLVISAAMPLDPTFAVLRRLAWTLAGITLGILLLAFGLGRAICRRALLPLHEMAVATRFVQPDNLSTRLHTPDNGDELSELGQSFNDLLVRLQVSFDRQNRFTGDASHQLRTPLAGILGQIEVALRRPRSADEYRQILETVQSRAEQLRRIIVALLFLARSDGESDAPPQESISLGPWLEQQLENWNDHLREKDIRIDHLVNGAHVRTNPVLMGELLNVLLDNACRYSLAGTPIVIRLTRSDGRVHLDVIDEGEGIGEADRVAIFEPFFRGEGALIRNKSGVGLGLSIASRISTALGITLSVHGNEPQGSRFRITLAHSESTVNDFNNEMATDVLQTQS